MIKRKNKKGVSVIIGYVLLVAMVVVLSLLVFGWLRTYVPTETLICPDEVSVYLRDVTCEGDQLRVTVQNNGFFTIDGYFLRATDSDDEEIATVDLSSSALGYENFPAGPLEPNERSITRVFNLDADIFSVELIPIRKQENKEGELGLATCSESKIRQKVLCSASVFEPECVVDVDCDDGNSCTTNNCNAGFCENDPTSCYCDSISPTCPGGDQCNDSVCDFDISQCVLQPRASTVECVDGNACTGTSTNPDHCDGVGGCEAGAAVSSDDGIACTDDSCDPTTGVSNIDNCVTGTCNLGMGTCGLCDPGDSMSCPLTLGVCSFSTQTCTASETWPGCTATDYGPNYEGTEVSCSDGLDNDCDGNIDSADPDCGSPPSCTDGIQNQGEFCIDVGGPCGGFEEGTELSCTDGRDNDCDGLTDGADPDCGSPPSCTSGQTRSCGQCGEGTETCIGGSWSGSCVGDRVPSPEDDALTCDDGIDNDCDGLIDLADPTSCDECIEFFGKSCERFCEEDCIVDPDPILCPLICGEGA